MDLWYPGADRFDVTITTPGGTLGPYLSPTTNAAYDFQRPGDFYYYHPGSSLSQDGLGKYGRAGAVSAANPFTTGVVALSCK